MIPVESGVSTNSSPQQKPDPLTGAARAPTVSRTISPQNARPTVSENLYNEERSMRRTWMWCVIGLLAMACTAWSQDKMSSGETEKAVAALEQQWLQSQKTNNPDLVAPLLADKFVSTGSDGKVTSKAETLAT